MANAPCARKTILVGFREAARQLWGEPGLRQIGERLPAGARSATLDAVVIPETWLPERYVMAWYDAVWGGPAQQQSDAFRQFIDRMMDLGFGRVRKFLLSVVTPPQLLKQAPSLWRHDHTHGELICDIKPRSAVLTLRDHEYCTTPLSRSAVAEVYRYAVSLSRTKRMSERHILSERGELQVFLEWD